MCELFGMSAARRRDATARAREFFARGAEVRHGWGYALLDDAGAARIEKEPLPAPQSAFLAARLREGLAAPALIGHLRHATVGLLDRDNCHPFEAADATGRRWVLAHNGTIFSYPPLDHLTLRQRGQTDSERILLHIVELMDDHARRTGRAPDAAARFDILSRYAADLSRRNKANLLVWDGEILYAHTNYAGSLHVSYEPGAVFLSTYPLPTGAWEPLPFTALCAFRAGALVRQAPAHGYEYIDNEADRRFLTDDFAQL